MSLFNLHCTGPAFGDATTPYDIEMNRDCTLREFVSSVLKHKGDWGYFTVINVDKCMVHNPRFEYRYGELLDHFPDELLDREIVIAGSAQGGWTRMDYYLKTKDKYSERIIVPVTRDELGMIDSWAADNKETRQNFIRRVLLGAAQS
jgi:hypothetical protein